MMEAAMHPQVLLLTVGQFFGWLSAAVGLGFLVGGMVFSKIDFDLAEPFRCPVESTAKPQRPMAVRVADSAPKDDQGDDADEHALAHLAIYPAPVQAPAGGQHGRA
jgi:hypothetical protein